MNKILQTALLTGVLSCAHLLAQITGVPSEMSYQAVVTDEAGDPLGALNPIAYEVTLRIYDAATGGSLLWAESQVTEIFQGRFSLIMGQGAPVPTSGGATEPRPDLSEIFGASERFVEVTVAENIEGSSSKTLAPRQKLVATATAFRAKVAERLGTGSSTALLVSDDGNVGIGTSSPGVKLDVNGPIKVNNGTAAFPAEGTHGGGGQRLILWGGAEDRVPYGLGVGPSTLWSAAPTGSSHQWYEGTTHRMTLAAGGELQVGGLVRAGGLASQGQVSTHSQGAYIEWNKVLGGGKTYILNQRGLGTGGMIFGEVDPGNLITELLRLEANGNVGIGTTSPAAKLDVAGGMRAFGVNASLAIADGNGNARGLFGVAGAAQAYSNDSVTNDAVLRAETGRLLLQSGVGASAISIIPEGRVGFGTTTPTARLHVVGSGPGVGSEQFAYFDSGSAGHGILQSDPGNWGYSILADGRIGAAGFHARSDARIKEVRGRSDAAEDLATLTAIEVTDYRYKDVVAMGDTEEKKVIAQQVEKVFPQAVRQSKEVVPDIFQSSSLQDGWIALKTTLKKGERVRLIAEGHDGVHTVLEVGDTGFRTDHHFAGNGDAGEENKVFVYGREVGDFRMVDYEAIAMLNVSATQEILRRLEAKEKEVESLKSRLGAMDAKMVAIERLLSSDTGRARTEASVPVLGETVLNSQ